MPYFSSLSSASIHQDENQDEPAVSASDVDEEAQPGCDDQEAQLDRVGMVPEKKSMIL